MLKYFFCFLFLPCMALATDSSFESPEQFFTAIENGLPKKPVYNPPVKEQFIGIVGIPYPDRPLHVSKESQEWKAMTLLQQDEYEQAFKSGIAKWESQCKAIDAKNNQARQRAQDPEYRKKMEAEFNKAKTDYDAKYATELDAWKNNSEISPIFSQNIEWQLEIESIASSEDGKSLLVIARSETGIPVTAYYPVERKSDLAEFRQGDFCIFTGKISDWKKQAVQKNPATSRRLKGAFDVAGDAECGVLVDCDSIKKSENVFSCCGIKSEAQNVIFLLDATGSMEISGALSCLRKKMVAALEAMPDSCYFNIIVIIGSNYEKFSINLCSATKANVKKAIKYLQDVSGNGIGDLCLAFKAAASQIRSSQNTVIFFLSDGDLKLKSTAKTGKPYTPQTTVTNDNAMILQTLKKKVFALKKCPVNAIQSATHEKAAIQLMEKIAEENKGQYKHIEFGD